MTPGEKQSRTKGAIRRCRELAGMVVARCEYAAMMRARAPELAAAALRNAASYANSAMVEARAARGRA